MDRKKKTGTLSRTQKKKAARRRRRAGASWLAMTAVTAFVMCTGAPPTFAVHPGAQATGTPATQVFDLDITPGPLGDVIAHLEQITGASFRLNPPAIADLASPGVEGARTLEEALTFLLNETGIAFRRTAPGEILLEIPSSTSIDVTASPFAAAPSSAKYSEPLRDIPQTISIVPSVLIEQQGATSLRDVLTNVPGITMAAGEGGQPAGDNLNVRGFDARNDIFVDGVRDLGTQSRDAYNVEQVEVTKGPGSVYSGRGSTGGSINMVTKRPMPLEAASGTLRIDSSGSRRITADINTPLEAVGERTAFRINLLWDDAGVPGRDVVRNEKWGLAPSLAFGLNSPTRVTLGYEHIDQDNISDYGVPWVPSNHNVLAEYRDRPAPVPRETFYGFRNRDVERLKASSGMIAIDHDFSDGVVFAQQVRYGHSSRESVATPPRFASPDSTEINREMRAWRTRDSIWSSQSVFRGDLDTGPITHGLVTGVDLAHETNTRQNGRAPNVQTSLLAPNPDEPYTEVAAYDDLGEAAGKTVALYAFDTLHLGEQWELVGGLRWERFAVDGVNTSLVPFDRVDTMHSLRTGLVYKPRPNGSLYLSYGTSLNPTLEGLSYSAGGSSGPEDLEPEKTYTVEAGSKWDLAEGRLLLSGSIFQVEKTNARTDGVLPDDPPTVLEGRQRARGIELGATGNLTRDWSIFGAFTFIDAKVVESNDPAESGNRLQRTPRHSGNVWTTLQIGDLSLGGGARFVGMRFGNLSNARRVDGYWTADLMASYPIHENVDLRLNVYNLNDAYYYDRLGGGHVVPGPGRAAVLSTGFRF